MTDHATLRTLAKAATPGPWVERGRDIDHDRFVAEGRNPADSAGLGCEVDGPPEAWHRGQFERHADAAYIAACDPQTILALLDELETLRAALGDIATMLPGSVPLPMTEEQYLRAMLHEVVRKATAALAGSGR